VWGEIRVSGSEEREETDNLREDVWLAAVRAWKQEEFAGAAGDSAIGAGGGVVGGKGLGRVECVTQVDNGGRGGVRQDSCTT